MGARQSRDSAHDRGHTISWVVSQNVPPTTRAITPHLGTAPSNPWVAAYATDFWNEKAATLQGARFVSNVLTYGMPARDLTGLRVRVLSNQAKLKLCMRGHDLSEVHDPLEGNARVQNNLDFGPRPLLGQGGKLFVKCGIV